MKKPAEAGKYHTKTLLAASDYLVPNDLGSACPDRRRRVGRWRQEPSCGIEILILLCAHCCSIGTFVAPALQLVTGFCGGLSAPEVQPVAEAVVTCLMRGEGAPAEQQK